MTPAGASTCLTSRINGKTTHNVHFLDSSINIYVVDLFVVFFVCFFGVAGHDESQHDQFVHSNVKNAAYPSCEYGTVLDWPTSLCYSLKSRSILP